MGGPSWDSRHIGRYEYSLCPTSIQVEDCSQLYSQWPWQLVLEGRCNHGSYGLGLIVVVIVERSRRGQIGTKTVARISEPIDNS